MTGLMHGGAVVFKSDDKENNPLDLAIALELGQKPLDLKNQEDQATISAAVKAVEMQKKFGQLNNMREDTSVFAKNTLLAASIYLNCGLFFYIPRDWWLRLRGPDTTFPGPSSCCTMHNYPIGFRG